MTYTRKCEKCGGDGWDMGLEGPYMCMVCDTQGTRTRQVDFEYQILARVEFTLDEVHHLMKMSQGHWYSTCRDASTVPGGPVYEMKRRLNQESSLAVVAKLTLHELGLLDRILEQPGADLKLKDTIASIRNIVRAKQEANEDDTTTPEQSEDRPTLPDCPL